MIPSFECGSFDCYTRFWFRWDFSPNRDFIDQVIEAFEEHLVHNESPKKHNRGKKRGNKVMMGGFEPNVLVMKPEKDPEISMPETLECEVLMPENAEAGEMEEKRVFVKKKKKKKKKRRWVR